LGAAVNRKWGWYLTTRSDWHLPHPANQAKLIFSGNEVMAVKINKRLSKQKAGA
jgi:hypothetical protein